MSFIMFSSTVPDDADEVDGEGYGQSAGTYIRIFQLLSCNRTLDAVDLAESAGLFRMSTLLSQIGGDNEFVRLISYQLDSWSNSESSPETSTIPKGVLDLYRLMGADPFPSDTWPDGSILRDIGWMRALGMIFWYCDSISGEDDSVGTLCNSLILYDQALQNDYVDEPSSPYVSDSDLHGLDVQYPNTKHGLYSLLQVFFRSSDVGDDEMEGRILSALRTEGYTRDPLDYRSAYIVLQLLECMGVASPGNSYASATRASFISQLINEGYWLWAVFIAMQTPDDMQRAFIVKELVLRHAVISGDVAVLEDLKGSNNTFEKSNFMSLSLKNNSDTKHQVHFLVNILHVPIAWVHEAAAHRYGYSHLYIKQVQHLNFAQSWRLAKEIICTKLAPLILVRSSAASRILLDLLESMDGDVDDKEDVWTSKSNIILSFLRLQSHVEQLALETVDPSDSRDDDYHTRMITVDYNEILMNAKSLLGRVQQLNTKGSNEPTIDHATLLNMGTYLFDLIDSHNHSFRVENSETDLFDSTGLFENSLNNNSPVLADHVLLSLHHHSSVMLKDASNRLSKSYIMSIQPVEMNMG